MGSVKENLIQDRSYQFAIEITKFYRWFIRSEKEYVLAKQVVRSGTSIGANIEESIGAASRKDFLNKIAIAYKEARETNYWLRILRDSGFASEDKIGHLIDESAQLIRILARIIKSTKDNVEAP